ncbi:methylated-DNA--[protein]-cysteine S-methyltransferase [Thermomonas hydrothermalis]|uniref:AraC family transcriptional regulator, regulatory protein of adaptative response / methylated-DNA-[protein]-cysteine methyltransferase n=1 Tax=Thermomonas hydrothermalis TaxID=213588 RepID=A0A1M4SHE9_9GAMM|nr:methylated-DNA--[protein]-cysteine S-methyltransferase [Thermomonas hydrothermalis]SHE31619.1 AraC family transcriptional regulator, regulatory protein of adaptative response / methylated-DNA-[protein]-cysteine methyltransferase [Thermomonas hydrothermalis]
MSAMSDTLPGHRPTAAALVANACRRIERATIPPRLATLAAEAGMTPRQFQRLFKTVTGMTPHAYAQARRGERLRNALQQPGVDVLDAAFAAGFNTASRFYAQAEGLLGMAPARFRKGGAGERIRFALGQCSLGALLVAGTDRGLCAIWLGDDPEALLRELQERFPRVCLVGADAEFERWVAQVVGMVEAPGIECALPLDIRGTVFQQRVWQALRAIPPGQTMHYAQLAAAIGRPSAVRAVAAACAANPLAVAIPCHRVVRSDGALAGYRWGVARKAELLAREAAGH